MFRLKVLGGVSVESERGPLTGRAAHKRRLALLSLLAASPSGSLSRDRITAFLWPESEPDRARHLLSESLYVLRRELGEDLFRATGDDLSLNAAVIGSDLGEFRDALGSGDPERAAALYAGPFLDGFFVSDAPAFERWVEEERSGLARIFVGLLEGLACRAQRAGDPVAAAEWWRRAVAHDRHSARLTLGLMRALDAAGERAAALRHAGVYAALLREELGLEPNPEVEALVRRLRVAPEPAGAEPPSRGGALPPAPTPPPIPPPSSPTESTAPVPAASPALLEEPASERRSGRPARRRWRTASAVAVLAALALAGWAATRIPSPNAANAANAAVRSLDPGRIAILSFEDASREQGLGYLARGLTADLMHQLGQVEALDLVLVNGAGSARRPGVSLDSVARSLGAGSIVTGTVQRSGERLRVVVGLEDASTRSHLASRVVERPAGELFALEDEIAAEVASFLRRRLGREVKLRAWRQGTRNAEARELLLRAQELREQANAVSAAPDAIAVATARRLFTLADSLLSRAEALDPRSVEIAASRGWLAYDQALLAPDPPAGAWIRKAAADARHALSLRRDDPAALELRGRIAWRSAFHGRGSRADSALVSRAEADLRASIGADPSRATAWSSLSEVLRFRGEFVAAAFAAERALQKDAYLLDADRVIDRLYRIDLLLGRGDAARQWCRRGREEFPDDWRFVECELVILSHPVTPDPSPDSARQLLRRLEVLDPPEKARAVGRTYTPIFRRMRLALALARHGARSQAAALVEQERGSAAASAELALSFAYDEACVLAALGHRDHAAALVRGYLRIRPELEAYARRDPQLRGIW